MRLTLKSLPLVLIIFFCFARTCAQNDTPVSQAVTFPGTGVTITPPKGFRYIEHFMHGDQPAMMDMAGSSVFIYKGGVAFDKMYTRVDSLTKARFPAFEPIGVTNKSIAGCGAAEFLYTNEHKFMMITIFGDSSATVSVTALVNPPDGEETLESIRTALAGIVWNKKASLTAVLLFY